MGILNYFPPMKKTFTTCVRTLLVCAVSISVLTCGSAEPSTDSANATEVAENAAPDESQQAAPSEIDSSLLDKLRTETWKGDLDGLKQRRFIRALVLYNKTNFFYDGPQPRGITYEALNEFEKFVNKKLNTGNEPIRLVFIPVTRSEALKRMKDGRGDIAASNFPIIPETLAVGDFSDPLRENASEVVVTGPSAPSITTIDDLSGKEVFLRKTSRYWPNLERLNERFKQEGKDQIILKAAADDLEDEDILNMVQVGVANITVADDLIAGLWAKVFSGLVVHSDIKLAEGDKIGWAVQKNTPEFLALVNEFVKDHKLGTSFGNTLLHRYLQNTKWASNNTLPSEVEKFKSAVDYFKKYGTEYEFDWLSIAAQAYQESQIDQTRRSGAGAVGVMQIKPSTAGDPSVGIPNVDTNIDNNIHAGVKYMDFIMKRYFADANMNSMNRSLFAFASYNAGPARVARLRKAANAEGLDPNVWFNNVEIVAAREIGAETVTYVGNIYKYYVAYKMASEINAAKSKKG